MATPALPAGLLPRGCKFLVDSNELTKQHRGYRLKPRVKRKLGVGDYSIILPDGTSLEEEVVVERKSLQNLVGEVSNGRIRWEKCLLRLKEIQFPHLVIEASLDDILAGRWGFSRVGPASVVGSMLAWAGRNRIPAWLCETAERGELITTWILARHANDVWTERCRTQSTRASTESS